MHMKSTIPSSFFISSCHVFRWIPNKIWSEEDDLSPDDFGELISDSEILVRNYAAKLSTPLCILRIKSS